MKNNLKPVAVTIGEPAGIGPEISLKAWKYKEYISSKFFFIGDIENLNEYNKMLKLEVKIAEIENPSDISKIPNDSLAVINNKLVENCKPALPRKENANSLINCIDKAATFVKSKEATAIVTNPLQKQTLYEGGFNFLGVTEFLGNMFSNDSSAPIMMLANPELRVVPLTTHLPLSKAINQLSFELISSKIKILNNSLQKDFGIKKPKINICGVNPHAGENGTIGNEEVEIIKPAIEELNNHGINISGPYPADSMFHKEAVKNYDAIVCMYHDQALIPIKTNNFWNSVNITLGLPIIRTSPDHGTALNIAGKNIAKPNSLLAAIETAANLSQKNN
ncbi:4-hydroxythreonine-4-phosphate dehydrogenase PdxA [Alphaproteobacteria bacterium]|nr:4-hydroxythreonine-4-phosphate dehydrogenase PdxA [Alphaproteobacteria bacterium]